MWASGFAIQGSSGSSVLPCIAEFLALRCAARRHLRDRELHAMRGCRFPRGDGLLRHCRSLREPKAKVCRRLAGYLVCQSSPTEFAPSASSELDSSTMSVSGDVSVSGDGRLRLRVTQLRTQAQRHRRPRMWLRALPYRSLLGESPCQGRVDRMASIQTRRKALL